MSTKKSGSIIWKVLLGVLVVAVVLGGMGLAYRMGSMRGSAMFPRDGYSNYSVDDDCPMVDDEGVVIPDSSDRYNGSMMGNRESYWGRGGMMGGRGSWSGMMPFGHGFFPFGGLLGGLLFIGLIAMVIRLLVGRSPWHRHFHGWGPHHVAHGDCPHCQYHGMNEHHHHEADENEVVKEEELNIDED